MMARVTYLSSLLCISFFFFLSGCISIQRLNEADPYVMHHHSWWNYYQRGRLYMKDGNFHAAQTDFQTALGQIPGARFPYSKDQWQARTYGMHRIEGYFPHRELGICLFEQNNLPQALNLLETSIKMEPSARAKFYINQIQKQLATASIPPRIETSPLSRWTRQRSLQLEGKVQGPNSIAAITINGDPEFIELAMPQRHFTRELSLQEGQNTIQLVADDMVGNQTTTNLILMADWTPPQIHLQRAGSTLSISCRDNLGLNQIQINQRTVTLAGKEHTLTCPLNPAEPLQLSATDLAGNRIEWLLSKKEVRHLARAKEAAPPQLHITEAGKTITLYNPEFILDLRAEDDTALRVVELNGNNLLTQITPLFRTQRRIPLTVGHNYLTIAAEDVDGNRVEQEIIVVYRLPEYRDQIYRLATALAPLAGEIPNSIFKRRVNHLLGTELTRDPVRFHLLAAKDEIQALLKEQTLSESELSDPRALLKQSKKIDADLMFITRVLSDGTGQTIYTQVLDTSSGDLLFIEDVYLEDLNNLPQQLSGLIMKIEQRFPLIQANIQQHGRKLVIDAGAKKGAQKNMRFLIVRSDGAFEQGHVIHNGNHPAELIISDIESETAQVIIARGHDKQIAQHGDFAFSR